MSLRSISAMLVLATTATTATTAAIVARATFSVREYVLPHTNPPAFAHDPAVAPDGIVYFADQQSSYIGRLDPETGNVIEYGTPTPKSGPHGIIVAPDGSVWYTGNAAGL